MKKFFLFQLFIVLFAQIAHGDDNVYVVVPKMPEFPGGNTALFQWIGENMIPVPDCQKERIQAEFVVYEDGSVRQGKILRGSANPKRDQEVLRLINSMPKWKPGELVDGTKVRVKLSYPFLLPPAYTITQNSSIIYGTFDECMNRDITWDLNKKTGTLSISGSSEIVWDNSWEMVQTLKLAADVKTIDFIHNFSHLKNINVDGNNPSFASIQGVLTNKEKTILYKYPSGRKLPNYKIPTSIQTLQSSAFKNAYIDTLYITSGVKNIDEKTFESATIKCFRIINNPLYTVLPNNILCKADNLSTVYYIKNTGKVPFISAQQFYNEVIEIARVSSSQKDIYKSNKPTVFVLTWETTKCPTCNWLADELAVFATVYKNKVNFYQIGIDIDNKENKIIKDYYSALGSSVPLIIAVNGVYQGDLTYFAYRLGSDNNEWLNERIKEMLAGLSNRKQ